MQITALNMSILSSRKPCEFDNSLALSEVKNCNDGGTLDRLPFIFPGLGRSCNGQSD